MFNQSDVKEIKTTAEGKMLDKLVDLADKVKLMREREEAEDAMNSVDRLTYEFEQAYWNLVAKVGRHRADEITNGLFNQASQ